jgi:hypothetical protein
MVRRLGATAGRNRASPGNTASSDRSGDAHPGHAGTGSARAVGAARRPALGSNARSRGAIGGHGRALT